MVEQDSKRTHDDPVICHGIPSLEPCVGNLGPQRLVVVITLRKRADNGRRAFQQSECRRGPKTEVNLVDT